MKGGKREGAGRPKGSLSPHPKDNVVWVRVTDEEKAQIEAQAKLAGKSVSRYLVDCALHPQ